MPAAAGRAAARITGLKCGAEARDLGVPFDDRCLISLELTEPSQLPTLVDARGERTPLHELGGPTDGRAKRLTTDTYVETPRLLLFVNGDQVETLTLPREPLAKLPPPPKPEWSSFATSTLTLCVASAAIGAGLGVVSALDRDGSVGRGSAIAAGALGGAALLSAIAFALVYRPEPERNQGFIEFIVETIASSLVLFFAPLVAGVVGAAGGGVGAAFASESPGAPRAVTGVVGGALALAPLVVWLAFQPR